MKIEEEEDSPEVIWTAEMKANLVERLTSDLEPYVKSRCSEPQAVYIYMPRPAIVYPELIGRVQSSPSKNALSQCIV